MFRTIPVITVRVSLCCYCDSTAVVGSVLGTLASNIGEHFCDASLSVVFRRSTLLYYNLILEELFKVATTMIAGLWKLAHRLTSGEP